MKSLFYNGLFVQHLAQGVKVYFLIFLSIGFLLRKEDLNAQTACPDLIVNGNFESGSTSFTSGLLPSCACTAGTYCVSTNFNLKCAGWPNFGDHTPTGVGNFLLVDGNASAATNVWTSNVSVTPGSPYTFSFWVASVYPSSQQVFDLGMMVNDQNVKQITVSQVSPSWTQYSFSGICPDGVTNLPLAIRQFSGGGFRDFGLDDISFNSCRCDAAFNFQSINGCGSTQFTNLSTGQAPLVYSWNFGDPNSSSNNTSNAQHPIYQFSGCGNFTVCLKISGNGCADSICQTVTYNDNTKPVITCPKDVTLLCNANTNASSTGYATATDNCSAVAITFVDAISGLMPCDATISRIWEAKDVCGNISTCVQKIIIRDNQPPIIKCPADVILPCTSTTTPSITGFATAIDNCTATSAIQVTFSDMVSGLTPCNATIIRTWEAKDACGNVSTCKQKIIVQDTLPPSIKCPKNLSLDCNSKTDPSVTGLATASDNCTSAAQIIFTYSDVISGVNPCDATITRTWQAKDACGNVATCIQTISVKDKESPKILCPANLTLTCNSNINPSVTGVASAIDNCSTPTSLVITYSDVISGSMPCKATITRTWVAKDPCGNSTSCIQTIFIKDDESPKILCPENLTLTCNSNLNPTVTGVATAIDNCAETASLIISYSDVISGSMPCNATVTRTWVAKDPCGNSNSCIQIIFIKDNVPPIISCPNNLTLACNTNTTPLATGVATATDNCSPATSIAITHSDVVSTSTPCKSTILRTWQAKDACGNTSTCVQTIQIKDTVPPAISCPQNPTVNTNPGQCYFSGTYPQPGAVDNCDNNPKVVCSLLTLTGSVLITPQTQYLKGINTITCYAIDACGNQSQNCIFTLTVEDNQAPNITCHQNVTVLGIFNSQGVCQSAVNNLTPIVSDNCPMWTVNYTLSGATTGNGVLDASGNSFIQGVTSVNYTVTDMAGNTKSCTLDVTVNCPKQTIEACCPDFTIENLSGMSEGCCRFCDKDSVKIVRTPHDADSCSNDPIVVCKNSYSQFIVYPKLSTFSYQWTITGGTTANGNSNPVNIHWGNGPKGSITVVVTDGNGCTKTITREVCFLDSPVSGFTFSPNTNICTGTNITFTNTSSGGSNYTWHFGDGSNSQLVNPQHQYGSPGSYTVTLVASSADIGSEIQCGCVDTFTQIIIVGTGPAIIPGCKEMICPNDTIEYCSSITSCTSFSWSIAGGIILGSSTQACVVVVWNTSPASLTLTTSGCGACNTTNLIPNVIWPNLTITGPSPVCVGSTNTYSLPTIPGTFYSWSITPASGATILINTNSYPNNYPVNNPMVNVNFTQPGTYTLVCNYHNPNTKKDCGGTDTIVIEVKPKFSISGGPAIVCQNQSSFFNFPTANWVISGPGGGWTTTSPATGTFAFVSWLLPGNYLLTAIPNPSASFCNPTGASIAITVKPSPALNFVSPLLKVCTNSLTNYSVISNLTGNVIWSFVFPSTGNIFPFGTDNTSASVEFTGPGPWTLQAKQDADGCPGTAIINVTKVPLPPPIIIIPSGSICSGGIITATVSGTVPHEGYIWSSTPGAVLTNGQGSTSATFIINSNATISISNCSGASNVNVTTTFSSVTIVQNNTPCGATLTASPGGGTYTWFLDGSFLSSGNPINITQNGNYVVEAIYPNGCKAIDNIIVTGLTSVLTTITGVGSLCNGGTVTLQASISTNCISATYVWNNFMSGPTITVNTPGSYWVTVSCSNGCTDISNIIIVQPCPTGTGGTPCIPDLIISNSDCANPVSLSTNIPVGCAPISTSWHFGDGTNGSNGNHLYANVGTYTVVALTTCSDGSIHCGTQIITVPMVDSFTYVIKCNSPNGWQILFQDASIYLPGYSGYAINWTSTCGSLSSTNSSNPSLIVPLGCSPTVTLTISKNGCTLSYSFIFNFPNTSFNIIGNPTPCKNLNYLYQTNFTTGIISYLWNFGDSTSGVTNPISHQFDGIPPNPILNLTITDQWGCQFTNIQPISVFTPPPLSITPSPILKICPTCPPTQTLSVTTPLLFTTYQWFQNGLAILNANLPFYDLCPITAPGNYYVTASSTTGLCPVTSNTVVVIQYPTPIAEIQPRTIQCVSNFPSLSTVVHSGNTYNPNYNYTWYLNDVNGIPIYSSGSTNYLTYMVPVDSCYVFIVKVTDNVTSCVAYDTACICFSKIPSVTISPGGSFCAGKPITYTATASPPPATNYSYVWQDGTQGQNYTTSFPGSYIVTATNRNGCSANAYTYISPLPYLELFPQGCDTLCDTAHLYFPIPLTTIGYPNYTINWYEGTYANPVFIGNGYIIPINTLPLGGPHNIFCIVNFNGCPDTTGVLNLFIEHCTDCACDSTSFDFLYAISRQPLLPYECGDTLLAPPASSGLAVNFYSFFHCIGDDCDSTTFVEWTLSGPNLPAFQNIEATTATGSFANPINAALFSSGGIYTLHMVGHCGKDTCPCTIYFYQPDSSCDCKGSTWGDINLFAGRNVQPVKLLCATDKEYLLNCNTPYTINTNYFCNDTACPAKATYTLKPPTGATISGSVGFAFTPNQSGSYVLSLYGWCGNQICDSCIIKFNVNCPDTCICLGFDSLAFYQPSYTNTPGWNIPVTCGNMVPDTLPCIASDALYQFHGLLKCSDSCDAKIDYTIIKPSGQTILTGTATIDYLVNDFSHFIISSIFLQPGDYQLILNGHCGDDSCECVINFVKPECGCKCGAFTNMTYTPTPGATNIPVNCNDTLFEGCLSAGFNLTLGGNFQCIGASCNPNFLPTWLLTGPPGVQDQSGIINSPNFSFSLPSTYFTMSGMYELMLVAICDLDTCLCKFKINIKSCDTCICLGFDSLAFYQPSYTNTPGWNIPVTCGNMVPDTLPCIASDALYQFHGLLKCSDSCDAKIDYTIIKPSGQTILTGTATIDYLVNDFSHFIISSIFLQPGDYQLILNGHCGDDSCECVINFVKPECGCKCGAFTNMIHSPTLGAMNKPVDCNDTLFASCSPKGFNLSLGGNFQCMGPNCPASIPMSWLLTGPSGVSDKNGSMSGPIFSISLPSAYFTQGGIYNLVISAICGSDTCYCQFKINAEGCDTCCTDSTAFFNAVNNFQYFGTLGDCAIFVDGTGLDSCMRVTWYWGDGNSTGPLSDATPVSHTYITGTGNYVVCYEIEEVDADGAVCWNYIKCDTIFVICDTCCKNYEQFCQNVMNAVSYSVDNTNCKVTVNIGNLSSCDYIEKIIWGDGKTTPGPLFSGDMAMKTFLASGTYIISYLAVEVDPATGEICFEKTICDTITVNCDTCSCGMFDNIKLTNENTGTSQRLNCNNTLNYVLSCPPLGKPYKITGKFTCNPSTCNGSNLKWKLKNGTTVVASGNMTSPWFNITINQSFLAGVNGLYDLVLTGDCGNNTCTCIIHFDISGCPPVPNECPCDEVISTLATSIAAGFNINWIGNQGCEFAFAMNNPSACSNDVLYWEIFQIGSNTPFLSAYNLSPNQSHNFIFPSGSITSYKVRMCIHRQEANNNVCDLCFERILPFNCIVVGGTGKSCNSSTLKNSGFTENTVSGILGKGGKSEGWTSRWGQHEILGGEGCIDPFSLKLRGKCCQPYSSIVDYPIAMNAQKGLHISLCYKLKKEDWRPGTTLVFRLSDFPQDSGVCNFGCEEIVRIPIKREEPGSWHTISSAITLNKPYTGLKYFSMHLENDLDYEDPDANSTILVDNICIEQTDLTSQSTAVKYRQVEKPIRIFPNPSTGIFNIELSQPATKSMKIRLIGISGQIVLENNAEIGNRNQTIEAGLLPEGMYFLQLISEGKPIAIEKLIKL